MLLSFSSSSRSSYLTSTVPSSSSSPFPASRKLNVASLVNIFCRSAAKAQQRSGDNCDGSNQKKKRKAFPTTSYSFHGAFRKNDRVSGPLSTMTIAESSISSLLPLGADGCVEESVCNSVSSQGSHSHSDTLKVQSKLMSGSPSRSGIPSSEISNNRKEMKQKAKKKKKGSYNFFLKLPRTGSRVIVSIYKIPRSTNYLLECIRECSVNDTSFMPVMNEMKDFVAVLKGNDAYILRSMNIRYIYAYAHTYTYCSQWIYDHNIMKSIIMYCYYS